MTEENVNTNTAEEIKTEQTEESKEETQISDKNEDSQVEKLSKDNEKLKQELETLRREHLTQEEQKQLELKQKEIEIADREATLRDRENRLHAIQALETAGLCNAEITSADLIPFVMDTNTSGIDRKVKALTSLLEKRAKAEVERIYQSAGRQPYQVSNESSGSGTPIFNKTNIQAQTRAKEIREKYTGGR